MFKVIGWEEHLTIGGGSNKIGFAHSRLPFLWLKSKGRTVMKRSEFEIGQYLFDGKHAFIHDGYVNADGYGVVIGYYEHELRKNSGYGNWQKTGNIRPATEKEISNLLRDIMYHDKRIKCYSEP